MGRRRRDRSVDDLLAHVRWAWEIEAGRGDRARELCLGILATNGVVLTLVVGDSGIGVVSGWTWLVVALHAASISCSVLGLLPRSANSVNYDNYVHAWGAMRADRNLAPDFSEEVLQELLQVGTGDASPLKSQGDANSAVLRFAWLSIVSLSIALVAAVAVVQIS